MLYDFLIQHQIEILAMTEKKSLVIAGERPSSEQLKLGLPIFYKQLKSVLKLKGKENHTTSDSVGMAQAAADNNEPAMAKADGHFHEIKVAESAGEHGIELLRLGYTLSHVVHAYGDMCQSITELSVLKNEVITASEFHDLNRCLDTAIAGAVTSYELHQSIHSKSMHVEHIGFLAHELRNALTSVNFSLQLIKLGTVGFNGNTAKVLDRGLKRMEILIDRSLTTVRLNSEIALIPETVFLIQLIDQIILTAKIEANKKNQTIHIEVSPDVEVEADQQLFYSALSNIIQNAIKYTRINGNIQIRGTLVDEQVIIEVEDECGGLKNPESNLFAPYVQQNENREGVGLGLTIAKQAMVLNKGSIDVKNLPLKGCIFTLTLPKKQS